MDKDQKPSSSRKRSTERRIDLPTPPPDPQTKEHSDALRRLLTFKERETAFLKSIRDTIAAEATLFNSKNAPTDAMSGSATVMAALLTNNNEQDANATSQMLTEEVDSYMGPLLRRTALSVQASLVTHGALDQLDQLHNLLGQLNHIQERNMRLRKCVRDVDTMTSLKKLHKQIYNDPDGFLESNIDEIGENLEADLENSESLLETMLAAGKSASSKRSTGKRLRQRSKSAFGDDIQIPAAPVEKELKPYPLRRQSAIGDIKAKVSKWTKVKAAFKWERANVTTLHEIGKSPDSGIGLTPINTEVARYLRVPSLPCPVGGASSADSILSSSSGHFMSGGSNPATPGTISSASSIEDMGATSEDYRNRDSSRSESRTQDDNDPRRSRSLDGDITIGGSSFTRHQLDKNKNKTPWRKVKDIIQTHRGSLKGKPNRSRSVKSNSSVGCSRDASPCDSIQDAHSAADMNHESCSSSQTSPIRKNCPSLTLTTPHVDSSGANSPVAGASASRGDERGSLKGSRRNKMALDIGCLPEGVPVDGKSNSPRSGKPPPSPLNFQMKQDFSDNEFSDKFSKWSRSKRSILYGDCSMPNSPCKAFEFFGEFESEEPSSGDISEPSTPSKVLSLLHKSPGNIPQDDDEIHRCYNQLQQRIKQEFVSKQQEWERARSPSLASPTTNKDDNVNPNEEHLSADFKKKLQEWRIKKQQKDSSSLSSTSQQQSPTKETEKKIDWNLWRMGQIKLEGQGLKPLPDEKDLPEEFQKKLDEWKKMKASGSSMPSQENKRHSLIASPTKSDKTDNVKKLKSSEELDKELQKIERERQRLEREKAKCIEREKLDKLGKLKAMVPPAKEVVVQTSKGVLKFEGISRKFTRKLYEWEKARGIGPEASTFALLHPGYMPLVVGENNDSGDPSDASNMEKTNPLTRSMSMDSISPHASVPSISHQLSSMSLNDVDDLKECTSINGRRISSNPEMDCGLMMNNNTVTQDEPEAVIVEVEDDIEETAAPLLTASPMVEKQTPVYRYEQSRKEFCAGKEETVLVGDEIDPASINVLKEVARLLTCMKENSYQLIDVKNAKKSIRSMIDSTISSKSNSRRASQKMFVALDSIKDLAIDLLRMLEKMQRTVDERSDPDLLNKIGMKVSCLKREISTVCRFAESRLRRRPTVPEINITHEDTPDRNVAICTVQPDVFHYRHDAGDQVVINQVKVMAHDDIDNDADNDEGLTRNLSKRKVKLRRLGSRQSSKTESDSSDEETLQNTPMLEAAPRRIKRKTSRANSNTIKLKQDDEPVAPSLAPLVTGSHLSSDDIVYVLNFKPKVVAVDSGPADDHGVLISPTETRVELIDASEIAAGCDNQDMPPIAATDASAKIEESKILRTLPPLPQSPSSQRRQTLEKKSPSPAIQMMIEKYNKRVSQEREPSGSNPSSPLAWRRMLPSTNLVIKSASFGNFVERQNKFEDTDKSEITDQCDTNTVQKSSSAGVIPAKQDQWINSFDGVQNQAVNTDGINFTENEAYKKERLYRKNCEANSHYGSNAASITGTIKKLSIRKMNKNDMIMSLKEPFPIMLMHNKSDNSIPVITRKYSNNFQHSSAPCTPVPPDESIQMISERALRLKKAKEEFLRGYGATGLPDSKSSSTVTVRAPNDDPNEEVWQLRERSRNPHNRLSQADSNCGSENEDDMVAIQKSASLGMLGTVGLAGNSASLPPNLTGPNVRRFAFSNIASKFRRVKMRGKRKDAPGAVSALCRQSLMVEIDPNAGPSEEEQRPSSSLSHTSTGGGGLVSLFRKSKSTLFEKRDSK